MPIFNDFMFYSRREKAGVCALIVLIVLTLCSKHIYLCLADEETPASIPDSLVKAFEAAVTQVDSADSARYLAWNDARSPYPASVSEAKLFYFDPNRADSFTFRRLGMSAWMARNIVRYRQNGGHFRKANDFERIYGLSSGDFNRLHPYIRIAPDEQTQKAEVQKLWMHDSLRTDSLPPRIEKLAPGTLTELNSADTLRLQMIPGIGSAIARRIVNYRERLGGFYRLEQLTEININAELLKPWLTVDDSHLTRIEVNRAGIERLRRHPYLNFYQAKALVEYRRREGKIESFKPFALYSEFTPADFERLTPYISFE